MEPVEQWKDIIIEKNGIIYDYSGIYQVSNLGRVRSLDRVTSRGHRLKGRILKTNLTKEGYLLVHLSEDGEKQAFSVHRLVATMFVENDDNVNKTQVNHKNETKTDNRAENIEWVTPKENMNYGTRPQRIAKKCSENHKGISLTEEHKQKISKAFSGANHPGAKAAICLETGMIFSTVKEASKWCGGNVGQYLRGKSKIAGGYHWMYYEDYESGVEAHGA